MAVRRLASVTALVAVTVTLTLTTHDRTPAQTAAPAAATVRAAATKQPDCGRRPLKSDGTRWQCTFVDNFDGTKLDPAKWYIGETAVTAFHIGQTCFKKDGVTVGGGTLKLTASNVGHLFYCKSGGGGFVTRYVGGHIGTVGRFAQTYGRYVVRARYPNPGPGLHAGYWLYPAQLTYGKWPRSGEIDATEWWSAKPHQVLPTLHYYGSTKADSGYGCTVANPTKWHTYRLIWKKTAINMAIDGHTCFHRAWKPAKPFVAPQPFDQPFNIIMNIAVDTQMGNQPNKTTVMPATYQVDYVKVWK